MKKKIPVHCISNLGHAQVKVLFLAAVNTAWSDALYHTNAAIHKSTK